MLPERFPRPGLDEAIGRDDYLEALALAEAVIRWVEENLT